jgi:hypothetical protein
MVLPVSGVNFQNLDADQKIFFCEYFDPFNQWREEEAKLKLAYVVDLLALP